METLKETINRIGRENFILYLYPELCKNLDVTSEDIARKHPKYGTYTINSQKTRLSKSKKIFRENQQVEALKLILESKKLDDMVYAQAQKYYIESITR